jgi:hypothetical protein
MVVGFPFRPDCDMNARDAGGNTPLMSAAICGRAKMLETFLRDVERAKQVSIQFHQHFESSFLYESVMLCISILMGPIK